MAISYRAQDSERCHMYQSTQRDPKFPRKNLKSREPAQISHFWVENFNHLNWNSYLATDDSATGDQTDEGTATDDGK